MKKGTKQAIAAVILILFVGLVLSEYMSFTTMIPGFPRQSLQVERKALTTEQKEDYKQGIGVYECSQLCYDSLAPTSALSHGSSYDLFWYTKRGTTYVYMGTGGTVAVPIYVTMTPDDLGYLYVAVDIHASANYHVDADKIQTTNSYIVQTLWTDVNDDTVNEFVFKYDLKGAAIPNAGYPVIAFKSYCFADDTSFNAVSSLSDLGNIGATTVTKWMEWDSVFSAAAKAVPLAKIEFSVDQTDTTLVQLKQIQIPGRGFLDASQLAFDELASSYRWTYTYGNTYPTAYYLTCPTGTKLTRDLDVKAEFTLGSTNVTCTLKVWWIDPETGTLSSDSDACAATYS